MKKRAFTLVELMVVLAIVALLSAIIFGAISSVTQGNKRGSCQGNLNQIYAAARLYGQDNDGQFPYLNESNGPAGATTGGLGLWALYVYAPQYTPPIASGVTYELPLSSNDTGITDARKPGTLASYLKSPRAFHCPSDTTEEREFIYDLANGKTAKTTLLTSQFEFVGSDNRRHLNPYYLSYQVQDPAYSTPTYSTFRGAVGTPAQPFKRQIGNYLAPRDTARRAPDQTVMTWCRFHRSLNSDGSVKSPDRTFDNVLFLDGSVQSVPVEQTVILKGGTASAVCRGWKRVSLAEANAVPQYVIDACNASP